MLLKDLLNSILVSIASPEIFVVFAETKSPPNIGSVIWTRNRHAATLIRANFATLSQVQLTGFGKIQAFHKPGCQTRYLIGATQKHKRVSYLIKSQGIPQTFSPVNVRIPLSRIHWVN